MIILIFKAKAIPENCSELLQSLTTMLDRVRKFKGCLNCYCYRSIEDDCEFCFIEQWAMQEHLNVYMRSDLHGAIHGAFKVLTDPFEIELIMAEDTTLSSWLPFGSR